MKIALALLLLLGSPAWAANEKVDLPLKPYQNQGPFVIVPGRVAASVPAEAGLLLGEVLCLPVSIAQGDEVPPERQASIRCGRAAGIGLGWPIYLIASFPFFLLKQAFWDGPRAGWRALKGS